MYDTLCIVCIPIIISNKIGAAYCCIKGCADWDCPICDKFPSMLRNVTEIHAIRHDAHGFVGYLQEERIIALAFTGTDPFSLLDWIDDIDTLKYSYALCKDCKVHKGFYDTYEQLRMQVLDAVKAYRLQDPTSELVITGHSLGGAMAIHACLDIIHTLGIDPMSIRSLITFGQPRVGNEQFQAFLSNSLPSGRHYRLTHHKDPVPHLPLMAMGFQHEPQEVFYKADPSYYVLCNQVSEKGVSLASQGPWNRLNSNLCTYIAPLSLIQTIGEDPSCANQYLLDLDIYDHLTYLGFPFIQNYIGCAMGRPNGEEEEEEEGLSMIERKVLEGRLRKIEGRRRRRIKGVATHTS